MTDVVKMGETVEVKVIAVDDQNRVKLSRRAVLAENAEASGENGEVEQAVAADAGDAD